MHTENIQKNTFAKQNQKFFAILLKKVLTTEYGYDKIMFVDKIGQQKNRICEHAGTGRQVRLRGVCQPTCGFKSHCSHQKETTIFDRELSFLFGALHLSLKMVLSQ